MLQVPIGNASNAAGDFGRVASRPGYPLKSAVAGAPSDNRSYPSRLQSLRSLRATLATACGGRGLAGGCSTARPSATRCPLRAGNRVLARCARCGPHHFPALRSGALAVCAPVLGREAAGAAWGERNTPPRCAVLSCHTCSRQQPSGSSAPLRPGQEALGRAVKAADREDRGAIFRTTRRLSAPTPPKSF